MADRIVLNTISYHGHGAIENIVPELTARGYKKAFVCSDPDLIKFGVTKKVTDLLDAANFAYSVYSEIKPNPTIANVQDGVAAFKAAEADCIVTIGGGSSMDTAKAIGIIINNPEFADVRSLEGVAPTKKHAVFTIAVINGKKVHLYERKDYPNEFFVINSHTSAFNNCTNLTDYESIPSNWR